ncbi:hypothetical protein EYS21_08960 [Arthrobacter sp. S39]|nr:hypothetical protein [Arthrobacter sp. S39]TAP44615.1 hypothetical protein EYS21_08960 [Arthrobacter sp. S39]
MNTHSRRNQAQNPVNNEIPEAVGTSPRSSITRQQVAGAALAVAVVLSATACGQSAASSTAALTSESASSTATPTPTRTAPASSACVTENATEKYAPKVFICTKSDAGSLLWMEQSESKRVTDARAAAAAKAAAEKAAADKAAQEAAAKAAAEQAAAEQARQEAAAAEAARQQQAAAAAAAAAKVPAPVQPAAPAAPSGCDPNYAGACVPVASDVDCAEGSGNGPAYVRGPVTVVGSDIYGLDRDGDGLGCE